MILRKPYAFFIKNFRLFHIINVILMTYLLYKTYSVLSFFGEYLSATPYLISSDDVRNLFGLWNILFPIIIILLSVILVSVMLFKKKPSALYFANIFITLFVMVILLIDNSVAGKMCLAFVDIRTIKFVRDMTTLSTLVLIYPIARNFVRAIGFDIKRFDFAKDLQDLKITEKDNEEFEVNVNIDTNKVKRGFNSASRISKYLYRENRFLINCSIAIVIIIITAIITLSVLHLSNKINMNTNFNSGLFNFNVTDAYITRNNNQNSEINGLPKNKSLVIVKTIMKSRSDAGIQFKTADVELNIKNRIYRHVDKYRDSLLDLGLSYTTELITKEAITRLFVFEVPTEYLNSKITIKFVDSIQVKGKNIIPTYNDITLNIQNLDDNNNKYEEKNNVPVELSDSIIKKSTLNINSIDISKKFKIDYTTSYGNNYYEYVLAPIKSNESKILLRISGSIQYDDSLNNINLNNLNNLINMFGKITYSVNGKDKTYTNLEKVNPLITKSEHTLYYAIPNEISNAQNVKFIIQIRNKQYVYAIN